MDTPTTAVQKNLSNGVSETGSVSFAVNENKHEVNYGTTNNSSQVSTTPARTLSQKLKETSLWVWRRINVPYHERQHWNNAMEGVLSQIGFVVGLGNMWRFPYYCYKYGGATFLVPYGICILLIGIPEFFVDVSLAQYMSLGPTNVYANIAPLFKGLGWAMVASSFMVSIYYNVVLAWALVYLFSSFKTILPWTHCTNAFNTPGCFVDGQNDSYKAAKEFFLNYVLQIEQLDRTDDGTSTSSTFHPELMLSLGFSWLLVFLCLYRGVRSYGKVAYVSVTYPYVVLLMLLGWSYAEYETSAWKESINKYFSPSQINITQLTDAGMWVDAATQVLFTLGAGFGGHATFSSYNKLEQNTLLASCFIVLWDTATSFLCGSVVFTSLSHQASELEMGVSNIFNSSNVLGRMGVELVFVVYPDILGDIGTNFWSILFFLMILALGIDSMIGFLMTVITAVFDNFKSLRAHYFTIKILLCFILFLLGLPMCTRYGLYMVELLHVYTCKLSMIVICLIKIIVVSYVYGFSRFIRLVENELNVYIPLPIQWYLRITLMFFGPIIFSGLLVWVVGFNDPVQWDGDEIPLLYRVLGWLLAIAACFTVPVMAVHELYKNRGRNWRVTLKATADFLPQYIRKEEHNQMYVLDSFQS